MHWWLSSFAGLLLTGQWRPVCAIVYPAPDCMARRAFLRLMDRLFAESGHCRRVWMAWAVGRAVRGYAPPPITGSTKARAGY